MDPRSLVVDSYKAAVAAVDPLVILPQHLPAPPKGRTLVIGAGKAAASMAVAVERHWPAEAPLEGVVITRYEHGMPTTRIRVVEAGHPVPDENGEAAAREILAAVRTLGADDLLLALVSGGGSSLLSLPVDGISMAELKQVTKDLLKSGAPIQDMNTVRKHLSLIQGGRLTAACKAQVLALVISDVTGDEATHIASGPCAPDLTTYADAVAVLKRWEVTPPASVAKVLDEGVRGIRAETPKPGDAIFARCENRVIGTATGMLTAAADFFSRHGIASAVLGDSVTGEAREVAKVYAALAREVRTRQRPFTAPIALISGGECTVTVKGNGRGGRCAEFLLSLCIDLEGTPDMYALAADTDGIDGSEDNAGAWLGPDSLACAAAKGLPKALSFLENNDAYSFFEALGDLIVTGPTRTNVNDYRVILLTR
jgi:hydroxypyruvate reductase